MRSIAPLRVVVALLAALVLPTSAMAQTQSKRVYRRPHHRVHHRRHVRAHVASQHYLAPAETHVHPSASVPGGSSVAAAVVSGTTYYVSPSGSDSNSGTSPQDAWQTVARVNQAQLKAGDGVLFEGGQTFSDDTLMPNVSGAPGSPIVFGSYGQGQATITQGVWFIDHDYLTFDNLAIGTQGGFQGGRENSDPANHITIQRCTVTLSASNSSVGIYSFGDDWTIEDNTVQDIGNSGMLLNGDTYTVAGNTITNVGLDPAINYNKHGIYLKASNAAVTNNNISYFQSSGISPRYRNSTIANNTISHGAMGISYFQYDNTAGTSHWTNNTITDTTDAGIFVCGTRESCTQPIESFVISGNSIAHTDQVMNLQPTLGRYEVG